jgi:hypothetical protein
MTLRIILSPIISIVALDFSDHHCIVRLEILQVMNVIIYTLITVIVETTYCKIIVFNPIGCERGN